MKVYKIASKLYLAADGLSMGITSRVTITFTAKRLDFFCRTFIALQLHKPLLLGLPWLRDEKGIIDLSRSTLHIGKKGRINYKSSKYPSQIPAFNRISILKDNGGSCPDSPIPIELR